MFSKSKQPRRPRQEDSGGSGAAPPANEPAAALAPPQKEPQEQEGQQHKQAEAEVAAGGASAAAAPAAAPAGGEAAAAPCLWPADELAALAADAAAGADYGGRDPPAAYDEPFSAYDPSPGTGRTGFLPVPPNNYPFYKGDARYAPAMQADGGQLSEWARAYAPTKEQADRDREAAYARGVPHGYAGPAGAAAARPADGDGSGEPLLELTVVSELHDASEYGANVGPDGRHSGGPFRVVVPPKTRVEELRRLIAAKGGVLPGLQRLGYAGKRLDDAQRTLEHYGVAYWHARFPHWPLVIRKH